MIILTTVFNALQSRIVYKLCTYYLLKYAYVCSLTLFLVIFARKNSIVGRYNKGYIISRFAHTAHHYLTPSAWGCMDTPLYNMINTICHGIPPSMLWSNNKYHRSTIHHQYHTLPTHTRLSINTFIDKHWQYAWRSGFCLTLVELKPFSLYIAKIRCHLVKIFAKPSGF